MIAAISGKVLVTMPVGELVRRKVPFLCWACDAGQLTSTSQLQEGDWRAKAYPRMQGQNLDKVMPLS